VKEREKEHHLHKIIKLLLHGNDQDVDGKVLAVACCLRRHVQEDVKDLTIKRLKTMLRTGKVPDTTAGAEAVPWEAVEDELRPPNPFLSEKELSAIMGPEDHEEAEATIAKRLWMARRDHLAKAINWCFCCASIHLVERRPNSMLCHPILSCSATAALAPNLSFRQWRQNGVAWSTMSLFESFRCCLMRLPITAMISSCEFVTHGKFQFGCCRFECGVGPGTLASNNVWCMF
jgi:hypothetical protein